MGSQTTFLILLLLVICNTARGIRIWNPQAKTFESKNRTLTTSAFCLGSFWRSEASFGCLNGVVRTIVGYSGGTKIDPEYRTLGDHAECVQVEYDPMLITFQQLLAVFWSSHDSTQVFGQGPDVGNQYRSIIFTNGTNESRVAAFSKDREQMKSQNTITTEILPIQTFYPAEPEHQKFELKRNEFLLHLMGNSTWDELETTSLSAKLNSYAAELCPPRIQTMIDAKINNIIKRVLPTDRELHDNARYNMQNKAVVTQPQRISQ